MEALGKARMETEVIDLSVLISSGLKGITAVAGPTERGEVGKPKLIGSWTEYVANFGGLLTSDDFPLYCKRALDNRARLLVCRLGHYADIDDKTTLVGNKSNDEVVIETDAAGQTVKIEAEAKSIGTWGDKISLTGTPALSGIAGAVDLTIALDGAPDLTEVIKDIVPATGDALVSYNVKSQLINFLAVEAVTDTASAAPVYLVGGVDTGDLSDIDYLGSEIAETGIHVFDNSAEPNKIALPSKAVPVLDYALAEYARKRGDLRAILRVPTGITGYVGVDYREVKPPFTGSQVIDTWYATMIYGTLVIADPLVEGNKKEISPIGDVLGIYTNRDTKFREWFAGAGYKRGRLYNVLDVPYNLGVASKATEANLVDSRGLNMVINHHSFGPVYWGNGTLQRRNTLLKHENVAELVIYLIRNLPQFIETELFDPNDPATWAAIYRNVKPFLQAIKDGRGYYDYLWQGDQDVDTIDECVVNKPEWIDEGKYVARLFIKPTPAMKYVGIGIVVTKSGVSFDVLGDAEELNNI